MKKVLFKRHNIIDIFFNAALVGAFVTMLFLLAYYIIAFNSTHNGVGDYSWLIGVFSDFVEIMNFSIMDNPYIVDGASSYPPLAIIILYPFALICKGVFAKYSGQTLSAYELTSRLTMSPEFWIAFLLFFAITAFFILFVISKKFDVHGIQLFKIGVIIMTTAPFGFALIRGNSILVSLLFIMAFLLLKDSKNPILREISYICLAVAGCLKIYPLFFGVFLLKDKKIFASLRVALYFAVIFLVSFFFFDMDLGEIYMFTKNLGGFMSSKERLLGTNNLSISSLLFKIFSIFSPTIAPDNSVFSIANLVVLALLFLTSCVAAIITRDDFKRLVICSSIVLLIPSISYFYVLAFTVLPFLAFVFNKAGEFSIARHNIYLLSFLFLYFSPFVIPQNYILHAILVIALLSIEIFSVFKGVASKNNSNGIKTV